MKVKVRKQYLRRIKLMIKSKLCGGILIKEINDQVVSAARYGAGILDLRDSEQLCVGCLDYN